MKTLQVSLIRLWTNPSRTNPFPQRQYMFQLDDLFPPSFSLSLSFLSLSKCLVFCFPFLRLIRPAFFLLPPQYYFFSEVRSLFSPLDFLQPFRFVPPVSCRFLNILDHISSYIQRFLLRRRKANFSSDTQLRHFSRMIHTSSLGHTAFDVLYLYNDKQFNMSRSLKMDPRLSRNVGKKLPLHAA